LPVASLAVPTITLSKRVGPPTSEILVSGNGFAPNVGVDIFFDTHDEKLVVTDNQGGFRKAPINAPRQAKPGKHWVTALQRNTDQGAQEPFIVETDWTQSRFDVSNSGFNAYENVLSTKSVTSLSRVWSVALPDATIPIVANGAMYFANTAGNVYGLTQHKMLWQYHDGGGSVFCPPVVVDGVVYFGDHTNARAVNARTGEVIWNWREFNGDGIYAVTVADGMVYFTSGVAVAYGLDATTGATVWTYDTGFFFTDSAPAFANGVVYISSGDLVALDAKTGKFLWSYPIGNQGAPFNIDSAPVVSNDIVYVGTNVGVVYAIGISSHSLLWSYTTGGDISSNLAVGNGVVYAASEDGNLYAFNAYSGAILWKNPLAYSNSPALANGVLYVAVNIASGCNLEALDAATGKRLWQYNLTCTVQDPSVADGRVYAGSGSIYAFGLPSGGSDELSSKPPGLKMLIPDPQLRSVVGFPR
jgi:outer membrane protein assembly factor BamB